MEKLMRFVQKKLTPVANFLASERHFSSMQNGIMASLSVILVSAVFMVIANPPVTADLINKGGFWSLFSGWYNFAQTYKTTILIPFNMTMGLISLVTTFAIAYNLAKSYKMSGLNAGIVSMSLFLMVVAPSTYYTLEGGAKISALSTTYLGAQGMFTSILVAMISVEITHFCIKHKVTIKLPDSVPPSLVETFATIIPLLINIIVFFGSNLLISTINPALSLPSAIEKLLAAPVSAVNSVPGALLVSAFILILWCCGVHGMMVVMPITTPITMAAFAENASLFAAGQAPIFFPIFITQAITLLGGTGNTLGFIILCFRAKSEQLKAFGKATIVPGIFRISEPVLFGAPVVFNPILMIPFVFGGLIVGVLYWIGCTLGLITPFYIMVSGTFPIFVNSFIKCLDFRIVLFEIIMIPLLMLIWYPFFKIYDNQLLEKEQKSKLEEQNIGV
ncbi:MULTISPECIES: PTS sugar transporter subunit IIC [unclassified Clostridium]|uniref:PTS sugar transporter subunit IIC n=1 Tax=unclassified Clostridium TaxID=2614128 RepID=UPI001EEDDE10|nr:MULTISPECIES: PTS transporter subunit EIIC [unclassified Clostridium]